MSTVKLNKIVVDVKVEKATKVDNRANNTGRPVNKKSNRQQRLAKQQHYANVNDMFVSGKHFQRGTSSIYKYSVGDNGALGCIVETAFGSHVCNVDYIGRTKVTGYTFVLGKRVNVELNLKTLPFVK